MSLPERPYLSIGEVLGLLLDEFPDVTISKIRFLESQGLIDPERTASGYRKFYDPDVERLRVILREQRENFLPLRVIRDRLESGEIDDTGGHALAQHAANGGGGHHGGPDDTEGADGTGDYERPDTDPDESGEFDVPADEVHTARHPAAQRRPAAVPPPPPAAPVSNVSAFFAPGGDTPPTMLAVERSEYTAGDVCALARITVRQLGELESFGLVAPEGTGSTALYSPLDLEVATVAGQFMARGVEARHLRAWKQAAEREASLFEQMVAPLLRQRNPQSRQTAAATLHELSQLGADLRAALLRVALGDHLEP